MPTSEACAPGLPHRGAAGAGWRFAVADSLEKVYPGRAPRPLDDTIPCSVFPGETASFQLAYHPPAGEPPLEVDLRLEFTGASSRYARLFLVELVPVELAAFPGHDADYDDDRPGLYPDLLRPAHDGRLRPVPGQWRSAWIDLRVDDPCAAGAHVLGIRVLADGVEIHHCELVVEVMPTLAPALELTNSHWLHADALADHYRVEVFSPEHWEILERFIAKAAELGANSLLTPVWTPPLDTAVGSYRTPVQLVGVHQDAAGYTFDFGRLHRWI
ncbi:MAG: glycoside hydrolase domain-containing protein, partial [Propionicimonas sp.]